LTTSISHYFGHDALKLKAEEDSETLAFKFQILRNDKPAYNLSEGECSLVAFCYFMAKLEDTESKDKKLVIYIDDPVSSLDSNHIFFVYSLIESIIASPETEVVDNMPGTQVQNTYRYEQLFISTHNLEFLKYLKRLPPCNDKKREQFIVIKKSVGSTLELMPKYLRQYITEFNYLFSEIYICSDPQNANSHEHSFYSFGNNMRKFLEAFLFFKYPSSDGNGDHKKRIKHFFGDDKISAPFVQRIINEFSHLQYSFDRCVQPIEYAEIARLATFILEKIKCNDSDQFKCLLKSINEPDPFFYTPLQST